MLVSRLQGTRETRYIDLDQGAAVTNIDDYRTTGGAAVAQKRGERLMKSILLQLADDDRKDVRMNMALALAARHQSHVIGFCAVQTVYYSGYAMAQVPASVIDNLRNEALEKAGHLVEQFNRACEREGLAFESRIVEGDPVGLLAAQSRVCDLVVVGQPDPQTTSDAGAEAIANELVLNAACPVLLMPYAGRFDSLGKRVLLAWNDSREASRAVRDALPILKHADKVTVLTVNPPRSEQVAGADVAAYLARHGVKAETSQTAAKDIDIGDVLVSAISDHDADFLVMGAWGHSRFREMMLGGATRGVLQQMTAPTFMSH